MRPGLRILAPPVRRAGGSAGVLHRSIVASTEFSILLGERRRSPFALPILTGLSRVAHRAGLARPVSVTRIHRLLVLPSHTHLLGRLLGVPGGETLHEVGQRPRLERARADAPEPPNERDRERGCRKP